MHRTRHFKSLAAFCRCLIFLLAAAQPLLADTDDGINWNTIETKYTTIRYQSLPDLQAFSNTIKYSKEQWGLKSLFATTELDGLPGRVQSKVDAIYERVQEILDMRKKMEKITINIYHDKAQLSQAFKALFKKECRIRAWYIYEFNTVYIQINDLHTGMLAHEMAHAVIDHFLVVRPPAASAEILARYVDSHLFK